MNNTFKKMFLNLELWLDRANSNKNLNIILMGMIIVSVLAFFFSTYPESVRKTHILIVPLLAGLNIYLLGSKNHILRETANFLAGLLFIIFIFFSIVLVMMGLVIYRSL